MQANSSSTNAPFPKPIPKLSDHILDEAVTLSQAVHGVVGLAHGADEAAEGIDVGLARDGAAVLVNLGDGDLDRAVILGLDDAVGSAALAGDVAIDDLATVVLHLDGCCEGVQECKVCRGARVG
ncbi:hypothetical protein CRV24_003128 [Beauveria bassiana]|nr:hypothetical protein CRV24_003128 [Beauveria bassiana]